MSGIDENILKEFKSVTLKDLEKVSLLNRIDIKYVFQASMINKILHELKDHYLILEIEDRRYFNYNTMYYDTEDIDMYVTHVRGKLNRFKVRHREYVDSGDSFLEVKFKNNKNRTIKWRTKNLFNKEGDKKLNSSFLKKHIPYNPEDLVPSLQNEFKRITLVDKQFTQRVTLDFKLGYNGNGNMEKELHQIAIAELKIDKENKNIYFQEVLKKYKIYPSGFSKYCIGKALSDNNLCRKPSNLKPKLLRLNKIANDKIYLIT